MNAHTLRLTVAAALRVAALVVLLLVIVGHPWPEPRSAAQVVLLTDRSPSVDVAALEEARQDVLRALRNEVGRVEFVERAFGRSDPPATDLEAALLGALATQDRSAIVVLSDGHATRGNTRRALEGTAAADVPVLWRPVVPDRTTPRIVDVQAPVAAHPRQEIPIAVRVGGTLAAPVVVAVAAQDRATTATATVEPGAGHTALLRVQSSVPGVLLLDVTLTDATTGAVLDIRVAAAAIEIEPPATVLYVAREPTPLARSLQAGGWPVERIAPQVLDGLATGLGQFAAVVLDDIAATDARPATWDALGRAVEEQGTGLLVLGGPRSFAAGGYRDSRLEALLPVQAQPLALGDAAAVAFVVDKSGSMGASAAGVDRFRLAQRAVVETAATLTDRDEAGVIVFDVAAREVLPLQAAAEFRRSVLAPWPAAPRGGTRLLPALELAITRLAAADRPRRLLVLVTDGYVVDADVATLQTRLAREEIELVALGVGPDADLATLQRLAPPGRGTVLRVAEAAELPALMRKSLDSRRAPVERGPVAVRERMPLPFAVTPDAAWPPVAAYAVTRARPEVTVHLESQRGDPLLASRQVGLGRVTVVTSGLGTWVPEWLGWARWPTLAGGLIEWVARGAALPSGMSVAIADLADELRVDVETTGTAAWSTLADARLRVRSPRGAEAERPMQGTAPGRATAVVPASAIGLYSLTVITPEGSQRLHHLRAVRPELGPAEASTEIDAWKRDGLVREWSPSGLRSTVEGLPAPDKMPSQALLLALLLFALGVVAERYAPVRGYFGWVSK
ncbi:MAG: VWA domain-containing protein [Steroidobacteraceae bacterium]|nr:VWA domain-containing protein [Steroidobacteraceae bacterium]